MSRCDDGDSAATLFRLVDDFKDSPALGHDADHFLELSSSSADTSWEVALKIAKYSVDVRSIGMDKLYTLPGCSLHELTVDSDRTEVFV